MAEGCLKHSSGSSLYRAPMLSYLCVKSGLDCQGLASSCCCKEGPDRAGTCTAPTHHLGAALSETRMVHMPWAGFTSMLASCSA